MTRLFDRERLLDDPPRRSGESPLAAEGGVRLAGAGPSDPYEAVLL